MGKILVHICCAPDALYFLERLRADFPKEELIGFFYDPNIHPYEEYLLRLEETKRACNKLGIKLIEGKYDIESWLRSVRGLENEPERGERCSVCFDFRLERSAQLAQKLGCGSFTTTLLMSPKKSLNQLKESGEKTASRYGTNFLTLNYRKGGGTQEMFRLTKENQIYQQDYCGCIYGLFKQKEDKAVFDLMSVKGRAPGSKEERLFIKRVRTLAESLNVPAMELDFPFLNWTLLEGGLWINKEPIPSFVKPFSQSIRGKLKADVEKIVGNTLYISKQFVKIELAEDFRPPYLNRLTALSNPTFVVPVSFKEKLLSNRIEATLRVEIHPSTSSTLLLGNPDAQEVIGIPADTLQNGQGIPLKEVLSFVEGNLKHLIDGNMSIALMGAYSMGRAGEEVLREVMGVEISELMGYKTSATL